MPHDVLLIDDSKAIHALVRSRLADEPITLHSAFTGQEGLHAARQMEPHLILLDVDLPDIEGLEVCRQLKADPATWSIPVIFMAGQISPDDRIYDPEVGAADFIAKPFNPAELKARIRTTLRNRQMFHLMDNKAQIDLVTELWNRAYFEDRLCEQLSLSRRTGQPLTCILADIDHFAAINASFGRTFGDDVLRQTAVTLGSASRYEDILCRFGPDEFMFLCQATNPADAKTLATRCQRMIRELSLACNETLVPITCSFGVAGYDGGKSSQQMIEAAEKSARSAHTAGGNRVLVANAAPILAVEKMLI
jgi:two-component system, cell cycle response regulator